MIIINHWLSLIFEFLQGAFLTFGNISDATIFKNRSSELEFPLNTTHIFNSAMIITYILRVKWLVRVWITLVLMLLSIHSPSANARDLAAIKASGKLIVAIPDMRNPPFFFEDQGKLKGLDIKLSRLVAEELGVEVVFNQEGKSFNDAVQLVSSGQADISAAKISRTLSRAQTVLFTTPYITLPHAMLVNRLRFAQIAGGRSVAEVMQNYTDTIGVIANSSFVGFAKTNFPKAKVIEFPSWDGVVDAVATGNVTMAYRDEFEVKRILKIKPDLALAVRSVIIEDIKDTIGIAVNSSNVMLLIFLNQFLEQKNIRYTSKKILTEYENFLE